MPHEQQLIQRSAGRQLARLKSPALASLAQRGLSSLAANRRAQELRGALEKLQRSRVSVLAVRGLAMFGYQENGPKLTKFAFWLYRGQDLFHTRPEQARDAFLKNVVIEPGSELTMISRARLYEIEFQDLNQALYWYERILKICPNPSNKTRVALERLHDLPTKQQGEPQASEPVGSFEDFQKLDFRQVEKIEFLARDPERVQQILAEHGLAGKVGK